MKIAVLTDSGSGLTKEEANALDIYFLPLQILHEENQYLDGIDITVQEVYRNLKEGKLLTTSMPPMSYIEEVLQRIKEAGYTDIICIPISIGLSSTASIITAAASQLEIPLHIVDCFSTCNNQKYLAKAARELVRQGLDVSEILQRLQEAISYSNTLIIPDDLQHLKRGGRLTAVAATLGSLLKIKPILQLNVTTEGKIDVLNKVRTMIKAQQSAIEIFQEKQVDDAYIVSCLHADAYDEGTQFMQRVQATLGMEDVHFGYIKAVIAVHTGIGCLGIQYIKKVKGVEIQL